MMFSIKRMVFLAAACIGMAAAPAAPAALATDDAAKIRAGTAAWVKAFNGGDVDGVVTQYAPDALVMPPGAPALRGSAAIKAHMAKEVAGAKAAGVSFALGAINDVGIKGDLAWHSGTYAVKDKNGATVDTGGYLEVWHKKGGKWLISRDIWNSSTPPPAPAAPAPAAPAPAPKK